MFCATNCYLSFRWNDSILTNAGEADCHGSVRTASQ